MRKIFILSLIFPLALTACGGLPAPTQAPAPVQPPTAEVIVVTVEVPVEVTAVPTVGAPAPAPTPTLPPPPAPTEAAPTVEAPTESVSAAGALAVDDSLGGGYFTEITYSNDSFSLRCPPKEITFTVTANDPYIVEVDLYYRIEDRHSTYITEWKSSGEMEPTGINTYEVTLTGESVHPDLRKSLAWFDFQFVGINKYGDVVGRSGKIEQLITYTIDCLP